MKNILTLFLLHMCLNVNAQYANEKYSPVIVGKKGFTEINFVGSGDIQLATNSGENLAASTGIGAIFWRIWPNKDYEMDSLIHLLNSDSLQNMTGLELQLEIKINVASTADTIFAQFQNNFLINRRSFGNYVMAPLSSGQATTFHSLWYLKPKRYNAYNGVTTRKLFFIPFVDGIELSGAGTNQVWMNNTISSNVSILAWKAGIFHEFISDNIRREKGYSIRFGMAYTGRSIQGDIGRDEISRIDFLSNKSTTYHGLDFSFSLRLKNIRAEASLPIMHMGSGNPVSGLSGAQLITSIGFVGGFPLSITGD